MSSEDNKRFSALARAQKEWEAILCAFAMTGSLTDSFESLMKHAWPINEEISEQRGTRLVIHVSDEQMRDRMRYPSPRAALEQAITAKIGTPCEIRVITTLHWRQLEYMRHVIQGKKEYQER